jgi:hypothetical protein
MCQILKKFLNISNNYIENNIILMKLNFNNQIYVYIYICVLYIRIRNIYKKYNDMFAYIRNKKIL